MKKKISIAIIGSGIAGLTLANFLHKEKNLKIEIFEKDNIKFRRSLFFVKDLNAGQIITNEDIKSIRPGYGLPPKFIDDVVGKVAIKNITLVDKIIQYESINSEWPNIAEMIIEGLPETYSKPSINMPHENESQLRDKKDYRGYYTKELAEKVYQLYRKDFEMFNYDKKL